MNYARNGGRPQRLAECRGLAPHALIGHALVSTEARLACPVGNTSMRRSPLGRRRKSLISTTLRPFMSSFLLNGPRGRTCTCNLPGLSGTPLHWATRGWCPRSDLHRHFARFKCAVSSLDYVGFSDLRITNYDSRGLRFTITLVNRKSKIVNPKLKLIYFYKTFLYNHK